jgi:hypothetical protein
VLGVPEMTGPAEVSHRLPALGSQWRYRCDGPQPLCTVVHAGHPGAHDEPDAKAWVRLRVVGLRFRTVVDLDWFWANMERA